MSTRSLRARLDRLARANDAIQQEKDPVSDFSIDPALARALRDDYKRLAELRRARTYRWPPINEEVTEEERSLRARFAERAGTISCPANYGLNEVWDDRERLHSLECGETLPPWFAHLERNHIKDQDAYEAQLITRIAAFDESPEGRARSHIRELGSKRIELLSATEQSELESLLASYPETDVHPKDPMKSNCEAWSVTAGFAEATICMRM